MQKELLMTLYCALYVPLGHGIHMVPFEAPNVPGPHALHDAFEDAPIDGFHVPSGHLPHPVCPRFRLNVPAGHGVQVELPEFRTNVPTGQRTQDTFDVAPLSGL